MIALTPAERAQIVTLATAGHGPRAIARALGRPVTNIASTYRKLQCSGAIPTRPCTRGRDWAPADTHKLIGLVEAGYDYDTIARRLRRTRVAIVLKCRRLGVRITTTNATLSARGVANVLGLSCPKKVSAWIRRGWLKSRNAGRADRPLWRVQWDDLTTFLESPAYWIAWDPARIPDPAFREWAQELRAHAGRYLTHTEVAARYHVGRDTVGNWIQKGELKALRYGNHFVHERDLVGFTPPCERTGAAFRRSRGWPRDGWRYVCAAGGITMYRRPHDAAT